MRVTVSGDVFRRGQEANIRRLYGQVAESVEASFGARPSVAVCAPLPWLDWLDVRDNGHGMYPTADLVIGFELPPAAKVGRWIDCRVHPIRFGPRLWSLTSNIPAVEGIVEDHALPVPAPPVIDVGGDAGCFACQVGHDASLIRGGRFIRPDDVAEGLRAFAARFTQVLVVPHPEDPAGVWPRAVLDMLPNAIPSPWACYKTLARCSAMLTVNSSTAFEAPHFGCEAETLGTLPKVSSPVDVSDGFLWEALAEVVRPSVEAAA